MGSEMCIRDRGTHTGAGPAHVEPFEALGLELGYLWDEVSGSRE